MTMEPDFDIKAYLGVIKRRYVVFIAVALGVFALISVVVFLLSPVYRAEAKILVESQQIPSDLAQATVTANAIERIQIIQQRLMTRNNLLDIAREFKLFPKESYNLSLSEIVDEMRKIASIEPILVGNRRRRDRPTIAFTVSFEYKNPVIAARVANKFVELTLEQNIRSRTIRATETRKFFERQSRSDEERLAKLEKRILEFKNINREYLPDSLNYRRGLLSGIQSNILEITSKLDVLKEQKSLWEARLRNNQGPVLDANASLTDKELERLRTGLTRLRGLYSDNHPEVKNVLAQIKALEKSIGNSSSPAGKSNSANLNNGKKDNETKVGSPVSEQLNLINQRIARLKANKSDLEKRSVSINETIARTPEIEILLQTMQSEYESLQAESRLVKVKMNLATVGEKLEEERQAERFEVIEQATAPSEPIKPKRLQILLAGSFASIAASIGLVFLLELMDKSVRGISGLEKRLQIRPIATIPYVTTITEKRSRRKKIVILLVLAVVMLLIALVAIDKFYLPLELVLQKILIPIKQLGG